MKPSFRHIWLNGFTHAELKIKAGGLQSQRREETRQLQVCLRGVRKRKGSNVTYCSFKTEWGNAARVCFILRSAAVRCEIFTGLETVCMIGTENYELPGSRNFKKRCIKMSRYLSFLLMLCLFKIIYSTVMGKLSTFKLTCNRYAVGVCLCDLVQLRTHKNSNVSSPLYV